MKKENNIKSAIPGGFNYPIGQENLERTFNDTKI